MAAPPLGSILLGTADPDRLRAWYAAALAPDQEDRDGWFGFGGVGLFVDGRRDVATQNTEPGRVVLNFHVDDIDAMAARLKDLGVQWLVEPEQRVNGWFATVVDPDGNYVQLVQLDEGYTPPW